MNTPPPRQAPLSLSLSRHAPENAREHPKGGTPTDTSPLPIAVTPEDTETWKEVFYRDMASYQDETELRSMRQSRAERQNSLARLALASGTGEDVVAFDTPSKRPRLRLEGKSLHALALLLAVILAGVWIYLGFDGKKTQGNASSVSSVQSSVAPSSPAVDAQKASQDIVVYISGAVAVPGVYTLPAGSRVNNLVEAAGGLNGDAQSALVNLASALGDGEHIHIPAQGEDVSSLNTANGSGTASEQSGTINLNTASATQLEELPGIGPALSQTIIAWREDNGRFTSVEDLLEVSGIGQAKYAKLKDLVSVG